MAIQKFKNQISAEQLTRAFLDLSKREIVCLLDSCAVRNLGSRFLFAGVTPRESVEINNLSARETLRILDEKLSQPETFAIFTISYEFGLKLENIEPRTKNFVQNHREPDISIHLFDALTVYDYETDAAFLIGDRTKFAALEHQIFALDFAAVSAEFDAEICRSTVTSNFTKAEYLTKIEEIKELIRGGQTYQTNLTQQFRAELAPNLSVQQIFWRLRKNHPAPFSAFIRRKDSTVVSASPERFFKIQDLRFQIQDSRPEILHPESEILNLESEILNSKSEISNLTITASPIKGTRGRGATAAEDARLRGELVNSEKDRAENVMIVDLLRNDIGKICEFGQVSVEKLCELETHPSLFHLVSTISGTLKPQIKFSEIIKAVFPCGSITGAPKISTMRIIDRLETAVRGLSMGAIGVSIQNSKFRIQDSKRDSGIFHFPFSIFHYLDLSVAIRTMVVRDREAVFNVGGGIVIDSDGELEYQETLTKAKSLFDAINADF